MTDKNAQVLYMYHADGIPVMGCPNIVMSKAMSIKDKVFASDEEVEVGEIAYQVWKFL
jgi:hypothetical protein